MSVLFTKSMSLISRCTMRTGSDLLSAKIMLEIPKKSYSSKVHRKGKSVFKLGLAGMVAGGVMGTGYSLYLRNEPRAHIMNEQSTIPLIDTLPNIKPSREVNNTE